MRDKWNHKVAYTPAPPGGSGIRQPTPSMRRAVRLKPVLQVPLFAEWSSREPIRGDNSISKSKTRQIFP